MESSVKSALFLFRLHSPVKEKERMKRKSLAVIHPNASSPLSFHPLCESKNKKGILSLTCGVYV